MADIKKNKLCVFGDSDFRVTNSDITHPEYYLSVSHDADNAVKTIGTGSNIVEHAEAIVLVDDSYIDLPANSAGIGTILVGDGLGYVTFLWNTSAVVTLIKNITQNVSAPPYIDDADTDGYFCIFDNGTSVRIRNRLGYSVRIMFEYTYTEETTTSTFELFITLPGVDNLDPSLTINGVTETPVLRYKAGDADGTDWDAWTYGETLTLQAGTAPTYNNGSPLLGSNDDSVLFNTGGWYQAGNNTLADITTEDFVMEFVLKWSTTNAVRVINKYASPNGYLLQENADRLNLLVKDGTDTVNMLSAALENNTWYHCLLFVDRSGYSQWYVNGTTSGAAVDVTPIAETITVAAPFLVGAGFAGANAFDSNVAYIAIWKRSAWLDTHLQGSIAKDRFLKLCGMYPSKFADSTELVTDGDMETAGTAAWSAVEATLSKDTTAPLYEGTQHLRITSTFDTFYAGQSILQANAWYRARGAARSVSGSGIPRLTTSAGLAIWTGTTSTSWQEFDVTFQNTGGSTFYIGSSSSHPAVVDFDNVSVELLHDRPTVATRAFAAYLDKVESGVRKLYYVGSEWLRQCYRKDSSNDNCYGYLSETQNENLIDHFESFSSWGKIDAGDTISDNVIACPDGRTAASSIVADSTDGVHGVQKTKTLTAATYAFSVFAKPGTDPTYGKDWIMLYDSTVGSACYFDVANGVVGTATNCTGYIEGPFYNGFYRCCMVFTGTAAVNTIIIRSAQANSDSTFAGNGSAINTYLWGAQMEQSDYMTSPIVTSGSAQTRLKDQLQFVAKDNIGGEDLGTGTVACDFLSSNYTLGTDGKIFVITDGGTSTDRIGIKTTATSEILNGYTRATGGNNGDANASGSVIDGAIHEVRMTWATNSLYVYNNGVPGTEDVLADVPDDLDLLHIGMNNSNGQQLKSLISRLRIYGEIRTDG